MEVIFFIILIDIFFFKLSDISLDNDLNCIKDFFNLFFILLLIKNLLLEILYNIFLILLILCIRIFIFVDKYFLNFLCSWL